MTLYKVECRYVNHWDDAGWEEAGKPLRFSTFGRAQLDIIVHVRSTVAAAKAGYMTEADRLEDFRVVPVEVDDLASVALA